MLSQQEMEEIKAEYSQYEHRQTVGLEALKIVQKYRGWVSDEALRDISGFLDMTPDELDSLATFYSAIFRKPLGRNLIMVCSSICCWIMGSESIVKHLEKRLGIRFGETTSDGRFTLLPAACLGACDHAPAMVINFKRYDDLDPDKIDEILETFS